MFEKAKRRRFCDTHVDQFIQSSTSEDFAENLESPDLQESPDRLVTGRSTRARPDDPDCPVMLVTMVKKAISDSADDPVQLD